MPPEICPIYIMSIKYVIRTYGYVRQTWVTDECIASNLSRGKVFGPLRASLSLLLFLDFTFRLEDFPLQKNRLSSLAGLCEAKKAQIKRTRRLYGISREVLKVGTQLSWVIVVTNSDWILWYSLILSVFLSSWLCTGARYLGSKALAAVIISWTRLFISFYIKSETIEQGSPEITSNKVEALFYYFPIILENCIMRNKHEVNS